MRGQDRERVRALELFRNMEKARFDALMAAAQLQRFPRNVELVRAGERPQFLHVLLDGLLECYVESDGRRTILRMIKPVVACMLPAIIGDQPYLVSAGTLNGAEVLTVPAAPLRNYAREDLGLAGAVTAEMAKNLRIYVKEFEKLKLRGGLQRLAAFLLGADAEAGRTGRIELPFEKRKLASLLGMSPENLSRALTALTANAVEVRGRAIRIRDRDALVETAHFDPLIDDPKL